MAEDFDFGSAMADFGGAVGQPDYVPISSYLPSSTPAADPTAMSGPIGGGGGFLGDLSGYAKQVLPFLQLGTQGLGAYTGIQGMLQAGKHNQFLTSAQQTAQGAAAPALAAGQQLIPAGTSALMGGNLPPGLEATVNNWKNSWRQQLRNYYAKAGITDSTMMAQVEAQIEEQAQMLRAQLAQGMISSGTSALQPALQGAQIGGSLAERSGDTTTAAIAAANQALSRLLGGQA